MATFIIIDGNGNQFGGTSTSEAEIAKMAQEKADDRGESVYYTTTEEGFEPVEVTPADKPFEPTHKIIVSGSTSILDVFGDVQEADEAAEILVQSVPGDEGGQVLYTEEEWTTGVAADWEVTPEGFLTRHGSETPAAGVSWQLRRL